MGSLFSPKIPTPPAPPPPSIIRDEVNRVEQVPVVGADGSTTYITRQIPLSAAEQAEKDELKSIMDEALSEIQALSSADYAADEGTQKTLNAWEAQRKELLSDDFAGRERLEEQALAQRGLASSSAATNVRRRRRLDRQDSLTQLQRERETLGTDIRNQQIGLQQGLFNVAASQNNAGAARQQQAAINGQSQLIASNTANRASLNDFYRAQLTQSQNSSPFALFSNVAGTVGAGFGASLGAGLVGNLFGNKKEV